MNTPIHDWTWIEAGIFQAFQRGWMSALSNTLNNSLLPKDGYALPEPVAAGKGKFGMAAYNGGRVGGVRG